jgi:hypothetical protein
MAKSVQEMMGGDFASINAGTISGVLQGTFNALPVAQKVQRILIGNETILCAAEHAKIRGAVEEALALGIVREEVVPSTASMGRPVYIFSSSHIPVTFGQRISLPPELILAQVQLFQLMHLLHTQKVTSPLFVEGRMYRMGYNNTMCDRLRERGVDIMTPEKQQEFFSDPQQLTDIINEQQQLAVTQGMNAPVFYLYTSYPSIQGGHLEAVQEQAPAVADWENWHHRIHLKYQPLIRQLANKGKGLVQVEVESGWSEGKPMIRIGEQWGFADDIREDCENFFRYAEIITAFNTAREEDSMELFWHTKTESVPMGFMGATHTMRVIEGIKHWAETHIITPKAAIDFDCFRSVAPANDEEKGTLNVGFYRGLHRAACSLLSQKQ